MKTGTNLASEPPSPARGLRPRPLPECEGASFPVLHEYFEVVYSRSSARRRCSCALAPQRRGRSR